MHGKIRFIFFLTTILCPTPPPSCYAMLLWSGVTWCHTSQIVSPCHAVSRSPGSPVVTLHVSRDTPSLWRVTTLRPLGEVQWWCVAHGIGKLQNHTISSLVYVVAPGRQMLTKLSFTLSMLRNKIVKVLIPKLTILFCNTIKPPQLWPSVNIKPTPHWESRNIKYMTAISENIYSG